MSFISRSKSFVRERLRLKDVCASCLRRRVAVSSRLQTATLLFGAFLFPAPLVADSAVDVRDAFPSFGAPSARPGVLCELAGLPTASSPEKTRASWETPLFSAPLPHSSSFAPSALNAPSTQNAQTAPIIRGGYISNLPIAPFRGRVFAYADASWGKQSEQSHDPLASGFDVASFGGGVGQDWRLSKNAIWGFGLQGRNIQLDPAASIYESEIDSLAGFLRLSLSAPFGASTYRSAPPKIGTNKALALATSSNTRRRNGITKRNSAFVSTKATPESNRLSDSAF